MTQNQTHLTVDDILSIGRRALDKTHGTEAQHIYIAREVERRLLASGAASTLAQPASVPHPGSPEASAMIDSELAAHGWPSNTKNAARAGYKACSKLLAAAPQAPQPAQAVPAPEPEVWLYDFMDGATTVRNWSTTNKDEAFAPGNFNQRGYVPAEN